MTGRVTNDGTVEFSASIDLVKYGVKTEFETMTVFYYQDEDEAMIIEDLGDLDWNVDGYQID